MQRLLDEVRQLLSRTKGLTPVTADIVLDSAHKLRLLRLALGIYILQKGMDRYFALYSFSILLRSGRYPHSRRDAVPCPEDEHETVATGDTIKARCSGG